MRKSIIVMFTLIMFNANSTPFLFHENIAERDNDPTFNIGPGKWRGVKIKFTRIDNKVRITTKFNGTAIETWESPHFDYDPVLPDFERILIYPSSANGIYEFEIEIINEHDKGHSNPWHFAANVYVIGADLQIVKENGSEEVMELKSPGDKEHNVTKKVGVVTVNKTF